MVKKKQGHTSKVTTPIPINLSADLLESCYFLKIIMRYYYLFLVFAFFLSANVCSSQAMFSKNAFLNPPNSVKVHAWWHWVDDAITKEGITKDLESMKKGGISQATILNVSLFNQ